MPIISVIVPVYNAEDYLDRCVRSILSQSFTDFELLLIDDGSLDKCGEICDNAAQKDQRIKVIHQKNLGVSAARNKGLDYSKGEYIFFCDSDDALPCKALENLYQEIQSGYSMTTGYFEYLETAKNHNLVNIRRNIETLDIEVSETGFAQRFSEAWLSINLMSCDGKLYRNDIIKKYQLRFNNELIVFEDFDFVISYMSLINSFKVTNSYVYSVFSEKTDAPHYLNRSRLDYIEDYIRVDEKFKDFLSSRGIEYSEQFWRTIKANLQIAYDALWMTPANTKEEKKKKLKRISTVLKLPHVQKMIKYQEFLYSRTEYHLLIRGNAFVLDRYYRFQRWMKKYFI